MFHLHIVFHFLVSSLIAAFSWWFVLHLFKFWKFRRVNKFSLFCFIKYAVNYVGPGLKICLFASCNLWLTFPVSLQIITLDFDQIEILFQIFNWFPCTAVRSLILDLVLTHLWFWDKPKLSVTFRTMKGKETFFILYWLIDFGMLILFKCHRTLDIAKTVMKERSYVHGKTDQIIHLSKDGKLEKVLCINWSRYYDLDLYSFEKVCFIFPHW
jgi:hypothetical protein